MCGQKRERKILKFLIELGKSLKLLIIFLQLQNIENLKKNLISQYGYLISLQGTERRRSEICRLLV